MCCPTAAKISSHFPNVLYCVTYYICLMWLFGVKFIIDKNAHNTISHGTFKSIANFLLAEERKKQKIFFSHTLRGGGGDRGKC